MLCTWILFGLSDVGTSWLTNLLLHHTLTFVDGLLGVISVVVHVGIISPSCPISCVFRLQLKNNQADRPHSMPEVLLLRHRC